MKDSYFEGMIDTETWNIEWQGMFIEGIMTMWFQDFTKKNGMNFKQYSITLAIFQAVISHIGLYRVYLTKEICARNTLHALY